MSHLLEIVEEITLQKFVNLWQEEEKTNTIYDQDPYDRMNELANYLGGIKCYLAALTFEGFQNVIVRHNSNISPLGGRPLNDIVQIVNKPDFSNEKAKSRLQKIQKELDDLKVNSLMQSNYILGRVFCPRQLTVISTPDHFNDFGNDKLYAVNFHRFVAYGQWVAEHGFQPAKVYYCEGADCEASIG